MNFEKAMVAELSSITGLSGKCFPLIAPQGTSGPFIVYRKRNIEHMKTLDGFMGKYNASYEVVVIANAYDDLQDLVDLVTDKFKSFLWRAIGAGGPLVENIGLTHNGDTYEAEAELYRADLSLEFKY